MYEKFLQVKVNELSSDAKASATDSERREDFDGLQKF